MKRYQTLAVVLGFTLLGLSSLLFLGCEAGSSDSATRNIGVDYTGLYMGGTAGAPAGVTDIQTGDATTRLDLRQSGDQLQAIDEHNIVFSGTVGDVVTSSGVSSSGFTLEGKTTVGNPVTISGTLSGQGSSGTMRGTWIEPSTVGHVFASATISPVATNSPTPVTNILTVTASQTSISKAGGTSTLTAQGGSLDFANFDWSFSPASLGNLSTFSGQATTFQANDSNTGTVTVTVNDVTGGSSKSVAITITP